MAQFGHISGHRFFDDTLEHGHLQLEDRDFFATSKTWAALEWSGTAMAAEDYVKDLGEGTHVLPQRFFTPYEVPVEAEPISDLVPSGAGRLPGFNTVHCSGCELAEHTRLVRWFMGHKTAWWCDFCHEVVPTLRLVG